MYNLGSSELDEILEKSIYRNESTGMYHCAHCQLSSNKKSNVKNHVESKHVSTEGVSCSDCDVVCKTRKALKMHEFRKHKIGGSHMPDLRHHQYYWKVNVFFRINQTLVSISLIFSIGQCDKTKDDS